MQERPGAEYSDDENNNETPGYREKRFAPSEAYNPTVALLSGVFALFCMVYSLYTTHLLVYFLSGNADGILEQSSPFDSNIVTVIVRDLGLLLLFVVQHVVMASSSYKNLISNIVSEHLHRSLYVLFTGITVQMMTKHWMNALPTNRQFLWDFSASSGFVYMCQVFHFLAWIHTFAVVFMLDFPEFIGLKQVYYRVNDFGCPLQAKTPHAQRLFSHFRHATVTGMMIVLWMVPCLTFDRLLLASVFTIFLFSAKIDEEDARYVRRMYTLKKEALQRY